MSWKAEVGKAFALLAIPITNCSCRVKGIFIGVDREEHSTLPDEETTKKGSGLEDANRYNLWD